MKDNAHARVPSLLIPRTLWFGPDVRSLDSFEFPERWILKANHRSQCVLIGKGQPSVDDLIQITSDWDSGVQAERLGEWAYSKARPLVFLEEWIGADDEPPIDYKFFVFDGKVAMIQVDETRFSGHKIGLYDREWNRLSVRKKKANFGSDLQKPERLVEMIDYAEHLGAEFDFMRIDLFETTTGIFFGETTPYPGGGLSPFEPKTFDEWLGAKWALPVIEGDGRSVI